MQLLRETELAAAGVPAAARDGFPQIDPGAEMPARDLLDLLGLGDASGLRFAWFAHESGPVFVRAFAVDERDFDTGASPAWMKED